MQNIPSYYIVYLLHGFIPTCSAKCVFSDYCDAFLLKTKKLLCLTELNYF